MFGIGTPVIEVAISLILLYVLLSLVTSQLNELIAVIFSMRAANLRDGIVNMLGVETGADLTAEIYEHPLIQALGRRGGKQKPAYIPSETFVTVLLKVVEERTGDRILKPVPEIVPELRQTLRAQVDRLPPEFPPQVKRALYHVADGQYPVTYVQNVIESLPPGVADEIKQTLGAIIYNEDPLADFRAAVETLPDGLRAKGALLTLIDEANGDIQALRQSVERWFNDTMERVSGWYKRWAQTLITIISFVFVLLLNADTIMIARLLWDDSAARAALVAVAESATSQVEGPLDAEAQEALLSNIEQGLEGLSLPLGWHLEPEGPDDLRTLPTDLEGILLKLIGLVLTTFAVSLGAPFWFDLLGRFVNIRAEGQAPAVEPVEEAAGG